MCGGSGAVTRNRPPAGLGMSRLRACRCSPLAATTPWVAFSGGYTARCESSGNASWLQIAHTAGAADKRPLLTRFQQPILGLHILDLNIALGNLVKLVTAQVVSYQQR